MSENPLQVLVLRGGTSGEREVSLQSGATVARACRSLKHYVTESDISRDDLSAISQRYDVVFPVIHGAFGEDGTLQGLLERNNLAYVGSDEKASKLGMDKSAAKSCWSNMGLPTAPWVTCIDNCQKVPFHGPFVVKPNREGSSLGVQFCEDEIALQTVVSNATHKWGEVIIEPKLIGPELTVGVLADEPLPVIRIVPPGEFYDYSAKYNSAKTRYIFDLNLSQQEVNRIRDLAMTAFNAIGCRDYGRVDLIVDRVRGPQLLEINTVPGFTDHSLLPMAAARKGISIEQLVSQLLTMAVDRAKCRTS